MSFSEFSLCCGCLDLVLNEYLYQGVCPSCRRSTSAPSQLMPRNRRESDFPVSRDWDDVSCEAEHCKFNRNKKCQIPNRFEIGVDGTCKGLELRPFFHFPIRVDGD